MRISEILRKAADECLWDGFEDRDPTFEGYSCDAVYSAAETNDDCCKAKNFLEELAGGGLDDSFHAFDEFPHGPERQGARFLWLVFAALVAEDWENENA